MVLELQKDLVKWLNEEWPKISEASITGFAQIPSLLHRYVDEELTRLADDYAQNECKAESDAAVQPDGKVVIHTPLTLGQVLDNFIEDGLKENDLIDGVDWDGEKFRLILTVKKIENRQVTVPHGMSLEDYADEVAISVQYQWKDVLPYWNGPHGGVHEALRKFTRQCVVSYITQNVEDGEWELDDIDDEIVHLCIEEDIIIFLAQEHHVRYAMKDAIKLLNEWGRHDEAEELEKVLNPEEAEA